MNEEVNISETEILILIDFDVNYVMVGVLLDTESQGMSNMVID